MNLKFARGEWVNLSSPPGNACRCGGDGFLIEFALHRRPAESQFASEIKAGLVPSFGLVFF